MSRIMIIDDDEDVLTTLRVLLKAEGHTVIPVTEGLEALERLRSLERIDLLLVDLRMAPVDGMELIRVAREVRPDMPILVVSAYLDENTIQRIEEMGCTGYIHKPFTAQKVVDQVQTVLADAGLLSLGDNDVPPA